MNTTQLECFMEVANCLNFSRAAERLRLTQPAVSHQVQTLENELGVRLFQRTSRNVRLTQEGFAFTQYAREMLKLARLSKARMKEAKQSAPLRLVIGCRNTLEMRLLQPALARLRAARPEALPVLRLIPFDSLKNLLAEGEIDLMFSFQPSAMPKIRWRQLACCPVVCVCSGEHPLAGQEHVTIEQLRQAGPIATCHPPICPPALFAVQTRVVGGRETGQILFCDHQEVMMALVEAGYAFAVTADLPHAHIPSLRYLPLPEFDPLSFGALYQAQGERPLVQEFLDLLEQSMAAPAP